MNFDAQLAKIQRNIEANSRNKNVDSDEDPLHELTDNTVTKSHALSRAYYRFGLVEKRCMEALISKLHPLRSDNTTSAIKLKAAEYSETFNVPSNIAYRDISKAVDNLITTVIRAEESNGVTRIVKLTLMTRAEYVESEGLITCKFNPDIIPYLIGLREKFNSYPLKQAVDFKSSYTWRFYEILVSWAQPKKKTNGIFAGWIKHQSVEELREMLGVPKSYKWSDLQRQVLDVVTTELKEKTNICINIKRRKTGRKITHLDIEFIENTQQQLLL